MIFLFFSIRHGSSGWGGVCSGTGVELVISVWGKMGLAGKFSLFCLKVVLRSSGPTFPFQIIWAHFPLWALVPLVQRLLSSHLFLYTDSLGCGLLVSAAAMVQQVLHPQHFLVERGLWASEQGDIPSMSTCPVSADGRHTAELETTD